MTDGTAEALYAFASAGTSRPLLGLRRRPGRLAAAFFRLPLTAYEHDAGPAVGRTFVAFTHIGRRTGQPHKTVAMVLSDDETTGELVICAAWGPHTDWYRNLQAHPAVHVQVGGRSFTPHQRFLADDEAYEVARQFRREHPHRLRLFSRVLGWGDLRDDAAVRELVRTRPFVAFRPGRHRGDAPWQASTVSAFPPTFADDVTTQPLKVQFEAFLTSTAAPSTTASTG